LRGRSSIPGRRWLLLVVVALLGVSVASVTASAGASGWHEAGATTAKKKKCKKKKHRSASSAKKKKCKKKKKAPPVVTPRGPIERIVLTWPGGADLDAHAWSNGLHDGWNEPFDEYERQIPGTVYEESNNASPNRERIVELNPNPNIVPLTFGICYYAGIFATDDGPVDATVTTVFTSGASNTQVVNVDFGDALVNSNAEGGAPDPVADWCP
jgi:hypothetical protein